MVYHTGLSRELGIEGGPPCCKQVFVGGTCITLDLTGSNFGTIAAYEHVNRE